jgi:hypothetical protein
MADAVVVGQCHAVRQLGLFIRGAHDVDLEIRLQGLQRVGITVAGVRTAHGLVLRADLGLVAVDDEDTGHQLFSDRSPFTAERKMRSSVAASTGIGLPPAQGSMAASAPNLLRVAQRHADLGPASAECPSSLRKSPAPSRARLRRPASAGRARARRLSCARPIASALCTMTYGVITGVGQARDACRRTNPPGCAMACTAPRPLLECRGAHAGAASMRERASMSLPKLSRAR